MVSAATEHQQISDAASGAQLADIEALYRAEYSRFVAVQDGFAQAIRSRAAFRARTAHAWGM